MPPANPPASPSPSDASAPVYRFENRTRSVFRFPRAVTSGKKRISKDFGKTVVLGDVNDADIQPQSRTAKTPSNVVELTEAQVKALGDRNLRVLRALVKRGDVIDHGRLLERIPEKSAA